MTDVLAAAPSTATPSVWHRVSGRAAAIVREYPATVAIVAVALAVGVATGALWSDVSGDTELYDRVAYGLPQLQDGKWWTYLTGAFFVPQLVLYIPVLGMIVVAASIYERRVGHWQTLAIVVGGQVAGALATSLFLWPFQDSGWTWAAKLADAIDVGISAGGFAVIGALSAVMQPVWRRRLRAGLSAYLFAMVPRSGLLWDVEHFAAWLIGLATGPFFAWFRDSLFGAEPLGGDPGTPYIPLMSYGDSSLWPYQDFAGIDDFAEIWWDTTVTGPDEFGERGQGMWRYADGAARYTPGSWPSEPPHAFVREDAVTEVAN